MTWQCCTVVRKCTSVVDESFWEKPVIASLYSLWFVWSHWLPGKPAIQVNFDSPPAKFSRYFDKVLSNNTVLQVIKMKKKRTGNRKIRSVNKANWLGTRLPAHCSLIHSHTLKIWQDSLVSWASHRAGPFRQNFNVGKSKKDSHLDEKLIYYMHATCTGGITHNMHEAHSMHVATAYMSNVPEHAYYMQVTIHATCM